MRLGILVSGRGSNLAAALEARIPGIDPVLVISNRPGVPALDVAAAHRVPVAVFRRADHTDADARDRAIGAALAARRVDVTVLAGYDQLLRDPYFAAFAGRTINIHPSLLPAHGGAGMVGLAVHRSVLEAGDPETGVTIHEVTRDLDAGPVLAQERVPVEPGDDAASLAARVLRTEHRLLVATLRELAATESEPVSGPGRGTVPGHDAC